MAKWHDFTESASSHAKKIAQNAKKTIKTIRRTAKAIKLLIKLAVKMVWGACKFVVLCLSNITVTMVVLAIMISVYGVVTVIVANELLFTLNPDKSDSGDELDLSALSEEEKYIAMAKALDRDKIEDYYTKNTNGFKEWYKEFQITEQAVENPAMMTDIFLLINEIYTRPEINGDTYDTILNKYMVLGSTLLESRAALPTGTRLFNSEIKYNINPSGYADPLGCSPLIWSNNTALDATSEVGCTFISQYENANIPDEQRAIYGGGGNISNNNSWYITTSALTRRDSMVSVGANDDAKKYLSTIKLKNGVYSNRGYLTYIPDSYYTFAYFDRIMAEGRDRTTHYSAPNYYYSGGNAAAVLELKDDLGLTKEQAGTIMGLLYCGDRHFHSEVDALPNFDNFSSLNQDIAGTCIVVNATLYLEGFLDSIASEYDGHISQIKTMFEVSEKIYGECEYGGSVSYVTKVTPDSAYSKCLELVNSNGTNFSYSQKWTDIYKSMETKATTLHNKLGFSKSERLVRMTYAPICYVAGNVYYTGLKRVVEECYNYQDSNGKYIFRTADIDLGIDGSINSGATAGASGWVSPVQDSPGLYVSSGYGNPNRNGRMSHFGSDISSANFMGLEYYAVKDATVQFVNVGCTHNYAKNGNSCGCTDGYGNSVVLDIGDGYYVRYGHCKDVTVKAGDKLKAGDLVAHAGCTGWSTGAHLHLEILHPTTKPAPKTAQGLYASVGCPTENPEKYLKDFFDVSYWYQG